jgi:hypothetical protein
MAAMRAVTAARRRIDAAVDAGDTVELRAGTFDFNEAMAARRQAKSEYYTLRVLYILRRL